MTEVESFDVAIAIFLVGTLAAAFVTGLAGFAFGMVAAGIWLHALTPSQTSALIAAYALLVQGHAVWKLRHSIHPYRLAPFIVGSAIGVPAGVATLRWISPVHFRIGAGVLLIVFSLCNLMRPKLPEECGPQCRCHRRIFQWHTRQHYRPRRHLTGDLEWPAWLVA
jgi:uncharacterized membrane protein YfcA